MADTQKTIEIVLKTTDMSSAEIKAVSAELQNLDRISKSAASTSVQLGLAASTAYSRMKQATEKAGREAGQILANHRKLDKVSREDLAKLASNTNAASTAANIAATSYDRFAKSISSVSDHIKVLTANFAAFANATKGGFSRAATGLQKIASASSNASSSLGNASREMLRFSSGTKTLENTVQNANNGLKDMAKNARSSNLAMRDLQTTVRTPTGLSNIMSSIGQIAATGASLAAPIAAFAKFEAGMSRVGAIADASSSEMEKLSQRALELGRTTQASVFQIVEGMQELASGGLAVDEINAAIESTIKLSIAGGVSVQQASEITISAINGFKKSVSELGSVNDKLVETINRTASDIPQLGEAMKYVAPTASAMGASIETVLASIGKLQDAGIKASMAGTTLRNVLDVLYNPDASDKKILEELSERIGGAGLQIRDVNGDFVGFSKIIGQLQQAGISGSEAMALFGKRGGPGMSALLNEGAASIAKLEDQILNANGTLDLFNKRVGENIVGAWKRAQNAITDAAIALGKVFAPAVEAALDAIPAIVSNIRDWIQLNPELSKGILLVVGGLASLAAITKTINLAGAIGSALTIDFFGIGATAGTSFVGGLMNSIKNIAKVFMPTFVAALSSIDTVGNSIWMGLFGGIATGLKYFSALLSSQLPALFASGGSIAGTAFAATFFGTVAAAFAGWQIGTWLNDKFKDVKLPLTDLNAGEALQAIIGSFGTFLTGIGSLFGSMVARTNQYVASLAKNAIQLVLDTIEAVNKVPGLSKIFGKLDDITGTSNALKTLLSYADKYSKIAGEGADKLKKSSSDAIVALSGTIGVINKVANARAAANKKDEDFVKNQQAARKAIDTVSSTINPAIEKANQNLDRYRSKFTNLSEIVRGNVADIRDSLKDLDKGVKEQLEVVLKGIEKEAAGLDFEKSISFDADREKRNIKNFSDFEKQEASKIQALANENAQNRIAAITRYANSGIAILEEQAERKRQLEAASATAIGGSIEEQKNKEQKLQREIVAINAAAAEEKKKVYQKAYEAVSKEIQRSIDKEKELAENLKKMQDLFKDALASVQGDLRELEREQLNTAAAKYADQRRQVAETLQEGDRAKDAGDIEKAVEKWKEASSLAKGIANEVKDGDSVIVDRRQALQESINQIKEAQQRIEATEKSTIASGRRALATQQDNTDGAIAQADKLASALQGVERVAEKGFNIKLEIDIVKFNKDLEKLEEDQAALRVSAGELEQAQGAANLARSAKAEQLVKIEQQFPTAKVADTEEFKKAAEGLEDEINAQRAAVEQIKEETQLEEKKVPVEAVVTGEDEVKSLASSINNLVDKTVTVTTKFVEAHAAGGIVGEFRRLAGNLVTAGSGMRDDVPALLKRHEYVLRSEAVQKYGTKLLDALNVGAIPIDALQTPIQKFAQGGLVHASDVFGSATAGMTNNYNNSYSLRIGDMMQPMKSSTRLQTQTLINDIKQNYI